MKPANETRRLSRSALRGCLLLVLSVLGVASPSATMKQPILTFIGPELQSQQEVPVFSGSQVIPSTKENPTFLLRLVSDGNLCPANDLNCSKKDVSLKNFTLLASDGHTVTLRISAEVGPT